MQITNKKPILSFDLDGTLMESKFGDKIWLEGLPKIYADYHNISYSKAKKQLLTAYENIGKTRREWYDLSYWIEKLNLDTSPEEILTQFTSYIHPFPEVRDTIKQLSEQYQLIISSAAMKEFIIIELQTADLLPYFSAFFSATSDTHTVKKDPIFYQMIVDKLQCNPKDIVHVGDSYEFDYITPIHAGLFAFHLDRTYLSKGKHVVRSLTEFEERIQNHPFD
jgi:5'-nucleotidase